MAATDHLGLQFSYQDMGAHHAIVGRDAEGYTRANLDWRKEPGVKFGKVAPAGEISEVAVHPDYQRKGVATHMWGMAREMDPGIRHSPTRTPEGDSWAKSVGGTTPASEQSHQDMLSRIASGWRP